MDKIKVRVWVVNNHLPEPGAGPALPVVFGSQTEAEAHMDQAMRAEWAVHGTEGEDGNRLPYPGDWRAAHEELVKAGEGDFGKWEITGPHRMRAAVEAAESGREESPQGIRNELAQLYRCLMSAHRRLPASHEVKLDIDGAFGCLFAVERMLGIRPSGAEDRGISADFTPSYSRWRHGGWYVDNVRYPSGACGCVSRNYEDRKWRIVCDPRPGDHTYPNRDAAARAEYKLAAQQAADEVAP